MKVFTFLLWLAWAMVGVRVLLVPFWALTVNQGMFLLLVVGPAIGLLAWINWILQHLPASQST